MDILIAGKKGSGKTYYMVYKALEMLKKNPDMKILHNIDGFQRGVRIEDYCNANNMSVLDLFSNSLHERSDKLHGYLFLIDEIQRIFPKRFKNDDQIIFFQMSRHYLIDTILTTQDYKLVCPEISVQAELILKAVEDLVNPLFGRFLYKKMSAGWVEFGKETLPKKQEVFELYKSANYDKGSSPLKKIKPLQKIMIVCVILACAGLYYLYSWTADLRNAKNDKVHVTQTKGITDQKRIANRTGIQKKEGEDYPLSLIKKFGGLLLDVSTYRNGKDNYVILLGVSYPQKLFPYKLIRTVSGVKAIVPNDVFYYVHDDETI